SVRAVATIGAPFDPGHVLAQFGNRLDEIDREGSAEVTLAGRSFRISREFVHDVTAARLKDAVRGLKRPLMILHAPRDEVVGIDNATEIFMAARHPKSFVSLDSADHLLSRAGDAQFAAEVIAGWAGHYVGGSAAEDAAADAPAAPPEGTVRVIEADPAGFRQTVLSGPRHRLTADEPVDFGGSDTGPGPYDLLAAGLGACTSMTIRMYARRKGLPLDHVAVDVSHDRIHAEDCADCETKTGKIDRFTRVITLEGALDEAQRARLMEIADRCPVHRTLTSEIRIETHRA
ncbi:MAG: OsmC family protein, partial [Alphaproteobacteria bacterium]